MTDTAFYQCKHNHVCKDTEIPDYGLDIYCPTCLERGETSPLDLIEETGESS